MDSAESRKRGLVVAKVARTYPVRPNMMHRNESATTPVDHATRPVATSPTPKRARPDDEATPKAKLSKEEKAAKKARKLEKAAALLSNESKPPVDRSLEESQEVAQTPTLSFDDLKDPAESSAAFMKANDITIHDSTAQECCTELAAAPFPKPLVDLLTKQGFSKPSAVQGATWPLAMAGRDVLAVAKTGSGKTLGFLLPALSRCHAGRGQSNGKPMCLVMAPTRELALQIQGEAKKFGASIGCRSVAVYGGAPKWSQASELQRGCEIVIATPGRMMDMLDLHGTSWSGPSTSLAACEMLVLDEADRMLDMGFEKDIRTIVAEIPKGRQTFLFTATWPKAVQRVAEDLLGASQCKVTVGSGGDKLTANKNVTQNVKVVAPSEKWDAFVSLIAPFKAGGEMAGRRIIIFANTKKDVNAIGEYCWNEHFACDTLSGDRTQDQRERVIKKFQSGAVTMVIATDVAARGLDIKGIERVINYDYPPGDGGSEDYIHRIGRTGRAGATGVADTLFTYTDSKHARELVRILTDAGQAISPELADLAQKGFGGGRSHHGGRNKGRGGGGKGWGKGGGKGGGKGSGRARW